MLEKITSLQSGTRKVDPIEKARVDKDLATNGKVLKSRKAMVCLNAAPSYIFIDFLVHGCN
jgi:hypothetical protein